MTNKESGQKLIQQARRILERDLERAMREKDCNLVVRRAQEVVELTLKGALRFLGIDYPKKHDVGAVFAEIAQEKIPQMEGDALRRITSISTWLAEVRGPSFYLEKEYGEEEAKKAYEDAHFVFDHLVKVLSLY